MPHEISDSEQADIAPNQDSPAVEAPKTTAFADSINVRIGLGFYGILLPIACNLIALGGLPEQPEWQSGEFSDKLGFVLQGQCGWPIFPFLIFAMVCLGVVIRNEANAFAKAWVRIGIFSGVFVCGWYLFAFSVSLMGGWVAMIGLTLVAAFWLVVFHGVIWVLQAQSTRWDWLPAAVTIAVIGLIFTCLVIAGIDGPFAIIGLPIMGALIFSTPLAFLVYLGASIRILTLHTPARRFTLSQLMIWVTWFATFVSAVRSTIKLSYEEYLKLPLEPPDNCYVATAASKGYPGMVGSQNLPAFADQSVVVNQQLATFKAAELALRAVWPSGHRAFRYFYNRLGPRAAAMLRGPLIATAAYLSLKPAEWLCGIVLRTLLGRETFQLSKKLYLGRVQSNRNPNA